MATKTAADNSPPGGSTSEFCNALQNRSTIAGLDLWCRARQNVTGWQGGCDAGSGSDVSGAAVSG
ncbi:MAG: hypothetical protein ACK5YF_04590, partial [Rhodobacterales bacterium]